jgi:hypothetical protein
MVKLIRVPDVQIYLSMGHHQGQHAI